MRTAFTPRHFGGSVALRRLPLRLVALLAAALAAALLTWAVPVGAQAPASAYVAESGQRVLQGFRLILNYELPLL